MIMTLQLTSFSNGHFIKAIAERWRGGEWGGEGGGMIYIESGGDIRRHAEQELHSCVWR